MTAETTKESTVGYDLYLTDRPKPEPDYPSPAWDAYQDAWHYGTNFAGMAQIRAAMAARPGMLSDDGSGPGVPRVALERFGPGEHASAGACGQAVLAYWEGGPLDLDGDPSWWLTWVRFLERAMSRGGFDTA